MNDKFQDTNQDWQHLSEVEEIRLRESFEQWWSSPGDPIGNTNIYRLILDLAIHCITNSVHTQVLERKRDCARPLIGTPADDVHLKKARLDAADEAREVRNFLRNQVGGIWSNKVTSLGQKLRREIIQHICSFAHPANGSASSRLEEIIQTSSDRICVATVAIAVETHQSIGPTNAMAAVARRAIKNCFLPAARNLRGAWKKRKPCGEETELKQPFKWLEIPGDEVIQNFLGRLVLGLGSSTPSTNRQKKPVDFKFQSTNQTIVYFGWKINPYSDDATVSIENSDELPVVDLASNATEEWSPFLFRLSLWAALRQVFEADKNSAVKFWVLFNLREGRNPSIPWPNVPEEVANLQEAEIPPGHTRDTVRQAFLLGSNKWEALKNWYVRNYPRVQPKLRS